MQFHTVSIGSRVPQHDFTATIQSVFESSINLRLAKENRLITVLVSDSYELPQGIQLDASELKEVQSAAKDAMRVGHSCGMDSVTGLLIGLTVRDDSASSV